MQDLCDLCPAWNFVEECDHATEQNGFVIVDMKNCTEEQTDAHYTKLIVVNQFSIDYALDNVSLVICESTY